MHVDILRYQNKLDSIFREAGKLPLELQSHYARYLTVLISGLIETSVQTILFEYTKTRSDPAISTFVSKQIAGFQNAKMNKVLELLDKFDKSWRMSLESELTDELKDAVDSIVALRHKIAHGQDVGASLGTVANYYPRVKKVIELIEQSVV